jgi:succinoglycan biosynthesis protein ExoM
MLQKCLESLARQEVPIGVAPIMVVADNEATATNRCAVEDFATTCPLALRYLHEPRRGISMARNAILDAALDLSADWIAFIDDDETAAPDWLAELMAAQKRHNADVVQGRIEPVYPDPTPFWVVRPTKRREGEIRTSTSTANVLFSASLIRPSEAGLRFDEDFALTGGEDIDFFARAHNVGASIFYSDKLCTFNYWPPERCSYRWQIFRAFSASVNNTRRERSDRSAWRQATKALTTTLGGVLTLIEAAIVAPISGHRFKRQALRGGKRLAATAGRIAALTGYRAEPYRRIRGF